MFDFFKVERYFYNCQAEVFEKFHKSPDSRDDQGWASIKVKSMFQRAILHYKMCTVESPTPYRVKDREAFLKNRIFRYKSDSSKIDVMKGIAES